jgi:steroid 5-alpha reductase family enzyme
MANYNILEALVHTWSPRFVLFLDKEQWEPYDNPRYVADKAMMWKMMSSRRRARYAMEMVQENERGSKKK